MKRTIFSLLIVAASVSICLAQNPIIQTNYTADPAPMVYNDRLYLYTSHDEDNSTWFTMNDWRLYTTDDMVNWTDHGAVMKYDEFKWAKGDAWAPQCVARNGKFYLYVPMIAQNNRPAIGVAVSDSPYGPFYDPLGKPLVQSEQYGDIDPTVFIDEDGQAYLYWGNPFCYYVKLNEDMISYSGEITRIPMVEESFGKRDGNVKDRPTLYEEGPWLYKHNKLYYLLFAAGPIPEHIGYATSDSPVGTWKYRGVLMATEGGSFTNHPGIVDFKGKTYFFYHNAALPGGSGFNRSVCMEEAKFNKDGTLQPMKMTNGIEKGITTFNPYIQTKAATIAWSEGVKSMQNKQAGVFITAMHDGSYTKVKGIDFRDKSPSKFFARVGTTHNDRVTMEVRLDAIDGQLLCTVRVPRTGGNDRWEVASADVANVKGVHDIYFVFKGKANTNLLFFDYWRFAKQE